MSRQSLKRKAVPSPVAKPETHLDPSPLGAEPSASSTIEQVGEHSGVVQSGQSRNRLDESIQAFGTRDRELVMLWFNQAVSALPGAEDHTPEQLLKVMPALRGITPRDEVEGMLAVQMVALHNVAMDQLRRAAHPDLCPADSDAASSKAAKLLRASSHQ